MRKTILLVILLISVGSLVNAQSLTVVGKPKKYQAPNSTESNSFTGYFNLTDIGLLIGSTDNSRVAPFTFMTVNGCHLTEQLSAGLGLGLEFPTGSYLPLVADFRYYVRNESFSPYFSLYGGFALPLDDNGYYAYDYWYGSEWVDYSYEPLEAKGSWLINPGFGFRHMFGENFGVIFGMGYRFQRLHYKGETDREVYMDFNRLSLKLGITFK